MTEVVTHIEIAAPTAEVWSTIMDPRRLGEWVTIHRSLHSASDGPPRAGDRWTRRSRCAARPSACTGS